MVSKLLVGAPLRRQSRSVESRLHISLASGVAKVREGEYDLRITDGLKSQWFRGLVVDPNPH